ncbi:hypothetical protein CK203_027596 [Vitis vinifera]|uniref:Retrotransposon gag protein n=1 Tax=Vitis vinifera TaxID=29760 RepID=A0A438JBH4_VITVI|nr:hypothetical protein CK203_027596 [Vitis vinifera]
MIRTCIVHEGQDAPPRMSAPSCIIPPTEQLIIKPHRASASYFPWDGKTNGLKRQSPTSQHMKMKNFMNAGRGNGGHQCMSSPRALIHGFCLSEDMEMKAKVAAMARKIEEMELRKVHEVQAISEPQQQANPCSICQSFEHMVEECPTIPTVREMFGEQANLIGQWKPNSNAPYGNTYNSSWRNHPNFAWKPRPNPYQSPAQSSQQSQGQSSVEQALISLSKVMGKFPSQPHQNPKGIHEVESKDEDSSKVRDVQAIITLRSGKEVHQPEHDQRKAKEDKADRKEEKKKEQKGKEVQMKESIIPSMDEEPQILLKEGMMKKHMPPPFPQALRGKKPIKNASEILDVLRQVKVNIPLLDMIKQVPTYAKFLKDLCTVKRGLNVTKQAFLTEQVSAIIQCKSPIKYKDPGVLQSQSILEEPKWRSIA